MFKKLFKLCFKKCVNGLVFLFFLCFGLLVSCNFLEGSDLKTSLKNDIAYAKAKTVNFTILPVSILQGQVTSDVTSAKIGYEVEISFEADTVYGNFCEWLAYSDYSYDVESNTITGTLLDSDTVSFRDPYKSTTQMTIKKEVKDLRIIPSVLPNPYIWFNSPSYKEDELSYTVGKIIPSGHVAINTESKFSLSAEAYSGYAIKNWLVQAPDGSISNDLAAYYNDGNSNNDVTKTFFGFDDDYSLSQNPLFIFESATISDDQTSSSALVRVTNSAVEGYTIYPVCAARPKLLSVSPDPKNDITRTQTIVFTFNRQLKADSVAVRVRSFTASQNDFIIDNSIYNEPVINLNTLTLTTKKAVDVGTQIEITLLPTIADSDGITLGESKVYTFVTSDVTDNEAPEILSASLKYYGANSSSVNIDNLNSTRQTPLIASHIKGYSGENDSDNFSISVTATDEDTGNSGIKGINIIERVIFLDENVLISKNDNILDYTKETNDKDLYLVPSGGKELYDSNGNWTGIWLSYSEQSRFKKTTFYTQTQNISYNAIKIAGIHQISVQAVDNAGNISRQKDFFIQFAGEDEWSFIKSSSTDSVQGYKQITITIKKNDLNDELILENKIKFIASINNKNIFLGIDNFYNKGIYGTTGNQSYSYKIKRYNNISNNSGTLKLYIADTYGCPKLLNNFSDFYIPKTCVGDVVLLNKTNGKITILSYDEMCSYDGASVPIAVVVYSNIRHCYGWALEQKKLKWCTTTAKGYNDHVGIIRYDEPALSEIWNTLCEFDSTAVTSPDQYPAFNYCKTYGVEVLGLSVDSLNQNIKALATEWFFPTFDTVYNSSQYKESLNESFNLVGANGITYGNNSGYSYWTSSEHSDAKYLAWYFSGKEVNSGWGQTYKYLENYVRPVFDFFDMIE